jgi:(+)-trans-carveol dehydrogenase
MPPMVERGQDGSIFMISPTAGIIAYQNTVAYAASKHGAIRLMKALAQDLGPHFRVNAVCPTRDRSAKSKLAIERTPRFVQETR